MPTDLSAAIVDQNRRRAFTLAARQGQLKKAKRVITPDVVRADLSQRRHHSEICQKLHVTRTPLGSWLPNIHGNDNGDNNGDNNSENSSDHRD
jgi:hypothetical protein